ncbi:LptE family protein [Cytophagaceae bacterium DM2B3-1]|uniref:LptE family protein n=1 Tax=Xanthocytophaga flava TaxID=3048013 RepID=A0AAE3U8E3_9BACT|nr:LptE family protein [Xanthocytophaga flavus]MDJ1472953.1 LptE family protein [Xanthocytophaga flavus]MDJ1483929.1 LptE family protein [Xanthocytophaga flavus]MDJ1492368.1 LptE family protein [Xanthocytophaga flavus]
MILTTLILVPLNGCKIYSFSGTTMDFTKVKTISINVFYNNAGNGPANMAQTFTERMRDYYQNNTPLKIVTTTSDLHIEGSIVGYEVTPVAPTGNQGTQVQASLQRLTMRVQVKYVNNQDEEQNFDQQFSAYEDFAQGTSLSQVESSLITTISDRIVYDVFNKSVANW